MAMVLINWLYIAITSFLTGYGILGLFARLSDYYAQLLLFIILILWLDEDEYQTRM